MSLLYSVIFYLSKLNPSPFTWPFLVPTEIHGVDTESHREKIYDLNGCLLGYAFGIPFLSRLEAVDCGDRNISVAFLLKCLIERERRFVLEIYVLAFC